MSEEGSVHEYVTDRANEADEVMRYISTLSIMESLILAQDERWRRA